MTTRWKRCAFVAACFAALTLTVADVTEAARMGGGRSFGGSSGFGGSSLGGSSGFRSSTPPSSGYTQPGMGAGTMGAGALAAPRSGMFGGMFGGFLAGSMLGSLFSGNRATPNADGSVPAQSSGPGLLDLMIVGGLGYMLFRLLRRRSGNQSGGRYDQNTTYGRGNDNPYNTNRGGLFGGSGTDARQNQGGGSAWDSLRTEPVRKVAQGAASSTFAAEGVDADEFLRGAKAAYVRMQQSWDRRDLDDIAQFATENVMTELRRQAKDDPQPGKTDLLLVNAEIKDVRDDGDLQRVAVLFDVLMREDPRASQPQQVVEMWSFQRLRAGQGMWKLDGIQQMA